VERASFGALLLPRSARSAAYVTVQVTHHPPEIPRCHPALPPRSRVLPRARNRDTRLSSSSRRTEDFNLGNRWTHTALSIVRNPRGRWGFAGVEPTPVPRPWSRRSL